MFDVSAFLRFGTTSLVLWAIERYRPAPGLDLMDDPVRNLERVASPRPRLQGDDWAVLHGGSSRCTSIWCSTRLRNRNDAHGGDREIAYTLAVGA